MKAAVITSPDTTPAWGDFAEPDPEDGQRVVDLVAAGIHPVVRARAHGAHYSAAGIWPSVPGVDAVARTPDGTLVYTGGVPAPWGTLAERMSVPNGFAIPLPENADPLAVAAGMNPGAASWLPLSHRAAESGEAGLGTVLVLGATGMAGRISVDVAFMLGAHAVVGAGRNRDRLAEVTARHAGRMRPVPLSGDTDTGADAATLTTALDGAPPSTVLDFVWGPVAEAAFVALTRVPQHEDGNTIRYIQIGAIAGATAALPGALLRSRRITMSGSGIGSVSPHEIATDMGALLTLVADGTLTAPYTTYPLSRIKDAWAHTGRTRAVVIPD